MASAGLLGQTDADGAPQLKDCVERPYAYISLDASPPRGKAGKDARPNTSVRNLLSNPSLDILFTGDVQARREAAGGSTKALSMVRGMLSKGASQIELALTGIVGRAGKPLLVLRVRLDHEQAGLLRGLLEGEEKLADRKRELGGHQTFTLRGNRGQGPGEVVEMALVGDDFVVGNDTSAMREVLEPQPQTTAAGGQRQVLSANKQFQQLRKRLDVPPGSLLAYGDWQRLGRRLQSSMSGAHAELLASSGLGSARSVMMTIAPASKEQSKKADEAFAATLLLDFEFDAPVRGRRGGIDGWFAATQPVSAKQLMKELPRTGLGGLVLSVDLRSVASHSPRTSHLYWDLREAFSNFGLDFQRNVLGRLVSRGTVQLHFGKGGDAFAAVSPVYAVRAKNRRVAQDLFTDMRRVVEENEIGKLIELKDERGTRKLELLHLTGRGKAFSAFLMVHDDSLLLAREQETLAQLFEELKSRPRSRSRRDQLASNAIKSIGGEDVAGLFDLDLAPMFERIMAALGSPNVDLSALPKRHVGYLATDRSEDGAVVRVRVLSSR